MTIPKIIHQTWKTNKLEKKIKLFTDTWKEKNPDFEYRFYNDHKCFKFINNHYPEYSDLYEELKPVERADIFRYLVLHKYGGIYADIDTECFKPMGPLLDLFKDSVITGYEYNEPVQYLQWFIACPKGHPTMIELVEEVKKRNRYKFFMSFVRSGNKLTYWLTGPELYTTILQKTKNRVLVLEKGRLGSFDKTLIDRNSYIQHHFIGSWK
jgi:mannosyltransferase OCH1-like enzyme